MKNDERVQFATGAVRSKEVAGAGAKHPARYDLVTPIGLRRLAETYGEGAAKYSDRNWEKGIPMSVMANHAIAHIVQYLSGDRSEDHLAHAAWNLMGMMHFEETMPEVPAVQDLVDPYTFASNVIGEKQELLEEKPAPEVIAVGAYGFLPAKKTGAA